MIFWTTAPKIIHAACQDKLLLILAWQFHSVIVKPSIWYQYVQLTFRCIEIRSYTKCAVFAGFIYLIWQHLLYKIGQNKILIFPFALINYSLNSSISFSYCLNPNFLITKDCTSTAWCIHIKLLWNGEIFLQFAELHSFLQENIYHFEYTCPQTSAPTVHSHTPGQSHRALTDWCRRPP